jgi:hypothetical protein
VAAHEHTEDLRRELAPQHLHRAGHRARHRACDGSPLTGPYAHGTVRYTLAPPLVQGPDTAYGDADGLRTWFATFDGPIEISYPEPFTLWFRSTFGLRRIDGDWRIVHQHESTPFYMDGSFKAAVDLTP